MPAPRLIFVDPRESARDHIDDTLADFPVRLVTVADGLEAFHQAMSLAPDLVILGSGLPHHQIQILLERTQGIHSLRHIAILVIAPEFSRENVLNFLKLGARDYLLEPHTTEALIQRIARHIPLGPTSPQPIAPRGSIGERLRQRRSKKLQTTTPPPPPRTARSTADIEIVEYKFTNDSGLLVRNESRQLPLSEKIDDYLLRLGTSHSHLVGILLNLLTEGKVRVDFRDTTERLALADPRQKIPRPLAIQLIDAHLASAEPPQEPALDATQRIVLP